MQKYMFAYCHLHFPAGYAELGVVSDCYCRSKGCSDDEVPLITQTP